MNTRFAIVACVVFCSIACALKTQTCPTKGQTLVSDGYGGWTCELPPAGPAGSQGLPGATGSLGAIGPTGSPGATGADGQNSAVPPGTIIAYGGMIGGSNNIAPPNGWLLCDGSAVSRTTYSALFAAIGISAGGGDGVATFNLPDYRGRFLRGLDDGTGRDPDAATRTAMASGGGAGPVVNSVEGGQVQIHTHSIHDPGHSHQTSPSACVYAWNPAWSAGEYGGGAVTSPSASGNGCVYIQSATTGILATEQAGGAETRPVNAAVNYLIKY